MIKIIKFIVEGIFGVLIVASPVIIGIVVGTFVYLSNPTAARFLMGICCTILGLVIGILWATRVWKKEGTSNFMSKLMATPELDKKEN